MENYFRDITAKVSANYFWNQTKSYDFSKFWLISNLWCQQQYNSIIELYTKFHNFFLFMKIVICSTFILSLLVWLRWLCMHLWLNLINRTIDILDKFKIVKNLCTKSTESCSLVISHILAQSSVQRLRATYKTLPNFLFVWILLPTTSSRSWTTIYNETWLTYNERWNGSIRYQVKWTK